ncbi:MAG: hypothetical protein WBP93_12790 [Pyrinomonadaceae bacterium]
MSTEQDRVRQLAERIARRVEEGSESKAKAQAAGSNGDVADELAQMRASLSELQKRIAQIESHVSHEEDQPARISTGNRVERATNQSGTESAPQTRSPWLSGVYVPAAHPSQERFGVDEAAVSELVEFFEKEKTCSLEPGSKPCDHCAMCSTRGF